MTFLNMCSSKWVKSIIKVGKSDRVCLLHCMSTKTRRLILFYFGFTTGSQSCWVYCDGGAYPKPRAGLINESIIPLGLIFRSKLK